MLNVQNSHELHIIAIATLAMLILAPAMQAGLCSGMMLRTQEHLMRLLNHRFNYCGNTQQEIRFFLPLRSQAGWLHG